MADVVVSAIVGKVVEYAIDPILRQFKYFIFYSSNIRKLRDRVKDLEIKESEVQQSVDVAERNAEDIKLGVRDWQQKVDNLKKQAVEVLKGARNSEMQCQFLGSPNLKIRYSLGRKAKKMTADVVNLLREGTFQKVGEPEALVQMTPYRNPSDCGAFKTRMSTKEKIMEALKDSYINIIGICGMPGVGKTTMATEIANEVNVNKLFDEVAMAVVSHDTNVTKIQDQLADMLGLTIEEKTNEIVRAGRLRKRLVGDRGKSILVILDDVWEDINLGMIGIPLGRDAKGLKILLTSRFDHVCGNLGAQRKFDVDVLSEEESWEFFKDSAGISHDATDVIKGIAEEVAMECGGLPLALVTVGKALRKREEYAWKNALEELRTSRPTNIQGVHKLVYSRIEFSYNYLESDEAKSLLLLCSLYPEDGDISIEDLVRYVWGLEFFKDTKTLMKARDRVKSIVDNLKSCYLLLSCRHDGRVKLHDVVRDVCLQIASKDKNAYMSEHTGLKEWPNDGANESYSAISLTSTELNQLPNGLVYPNLKFLLVGGQGQRQTLRISKDFFENMRELSVLDFTSMAIQIPLSIGLLTNLRTLCLDYCKLINDISAIGSLTKLEVLSFLGSDVDHLPNDMRLLSNLRSLDLRLKCTTSYFLLPPSILLHLKKLEELYLGAIGIRDDELEQRRYIIEEISSLTHLNTFQISTDNPQFLLEILHVLCIEKLERFHIGLTDISNAISSNLEHYDFSRRLHVRHTDDSMLLQPLNSLMSRADYLSIEMEEHNLDDISVQVVERKNMLDEYCGFEYLIDMCDGNYRTGAFAGLQEIYLNGLPRMKHLWRGVIKPPSLQNLTTLDMVYCPSVKSLFLVSVTLSMVNLESLCISYCKLLEEVVSVEIEQNEVSQMLEFPKLREIDLRYLSNFKSFRSEPNKAVGAIRPLFNQVTFPSLESLTIEGLKRELNIMYELRKVKSHELKALNVSSQDDMSTLFDFEVIEDDSEISILSRLNSLHLANLPKLVQITRMVPKGIGLFRNLTSLRVSYCDSLRYLFSASLAVSLLALETVEVFECEAIEEIIGREETEGTSENEIVFPKLRFIDLVSLDRFRMFSSQNYQLVFPSLVRVEIRECPLMENFCFGQLTAPRLSEVKSSQGIHGFSWDNFRPTAYSGWFSIYEGSGLPARPI